MCMINTAVVNGEQRSFGSNALLWSMMCKEPAVGL